MVDFLVRHTTSANKCATTFVDASGDDATDRRGQSVLAWCRKRGRPKRTVPTSWSTRTLAILSAARRISGPSGMRTTWFNNLFNTQGWPRQLWWAQVLSTLRVSLILATARTIWEPSINTREI